MTLTLSTAAREAAAKLDDVRAAGNIPAVIYGAGKDAVSIVVPEGEFIKVFREAGESTMIDLNTEGKTQQVLIQDVQTHPVSGNVLHIDFKVIEAGKAIEVTVPLEFIGESPAAKQNLGSLTKVLHEVDIEVLPKDLPSEIQVDVSSLATLEDQILVKDLQVPAGVTVLTEAEEAVAVITAAKEEEEEAPAEAIDFSQIEVEQKGKGEDAEAAAE
jgi:large subunit ribosomal protein L25